MPRPLARLGLVGGPLIILSGTLVMFGVERQHGTLQGLMTIREFIWELGLGIYPLIWGFRRTRVVEEYESARGTSAATASV